MAKQVFLSYSSKDNKIASSICSALEARGHHCWMSSRDVRPGENFQGAIVRAIREARVMVMVFSSNANNSDEIKKEMALASHSRLMVIPVRAEDVLPSEDFTYELATRQWIDMFDDWEQAIEQLGAQIDLAVPQEEGRSQSTASSPASHPAASKKSRVPLFAGIAALLLAAAAGAFWFTRPLAPPQPVPRPAESAPHVAQTQPAPSSAMDPAKLESDLWDSVKNSGDRSALNSYLAKYPDGIFAAAARAKLAALNKSAMVKTEKAPTPDPAVNEAAASAQQAIPASQSAPVSSAGTTPNPRVQQAIDRARQTEQRARAIAEKAEATAGQDSSGQSGPGMFGPHGGPRRGGRMMGERTAGLNVISYPGGDHYAGGTRNGKRFGLGIMTGASNRLYRERVGQYVADLLDGYGVVYRRDGNVRIGQWKDGMMNGYGALLNANGRIIEQGVYANDRLTTPLKGN
jgi:hypothetical protein